MNNIYMVILLFTTAPIYAADIDRIFDAQKKSAAPATSVDSDVFTSADESNRAVMKKTEEMNERRRQMAREGAANRAYEERSGRDWTVLGEKQGSGWTWFAKEYYVQCNFGLYTNKTFFIYLKKSGGWQSSTGPTTKTLAESAKFECESIR